jgi:AcrR family transcriptional regulator
MSASPKASKPEPIPSDPLIEAAIALIIETGDLRKVTMRAVAERAGMALGLASYRYGGKEGLIREAVRVFMGRAIGFGIHILIT